MISGLDRIVMAVPHAAEVARRWTAALGAVPHRTLSLPAIGAHSTELRLGRSVVEILQPDGAGAVADAVAARGPHLFAAGLASPDMAALGNRLRGRGVEAVAADGRLWLSPDSIGVPGLRLSVAAEVAREPVGDIDYLYEATLLAADHAAATDRFAAVFGLDTDPFVAIRSEKYGYEGTLTLFRAGHLARLEIITPTDPKATMGRFFGKFGDSLYMSFAECDRLLAIEARLKQAGERSTPTRPEGRSPDKGPDSLFVHPPSLGGMMLGLSRPSMAWSWSGAPERVQGID